MVPGTIGTPASFMSSRARVFEPMRVHRVGGRADEHDAGLLAGPREGGVFRQEAIAGVDCLGARLARGLEDLLHVQVALRGGTGAKQVGLAGPPGVRGVAIRLGVNGHAGHAELLQRAHHTDGDLAPVGHEDLAEHEAGRLLAWFAATCSPVSWPR